MKNCYTVLLILTSCSCLIFVAAAQEQTNTNIPSLESNSAAPIESGINRDLDQLMTSVYCYCGCVRDTIKHCVCVTAQQIETDFRNRLIAGETVQQIRADYLARYGTQYSALMPAKGFNIVAYAMPAIIIVLIGIIVFFVLRSKRKAALVKSPDSTEPQESVSAEQYEQIEEELRSRSERRR